VDELAHHQDDQEEAEHAGRQRAGESERAIRPVSRRRACQQVWVRVIGGRWRDAGEVIRRGWSGRDRALGGNLWLCRIGRLYPFHPADKIPQPRKERLNRVAYRVAGQVAGSSTRPSLPWLYSVNQAQPSVVIARWSGQRPVL